MLALWVAVYVRLVWRDRCHDEDLLAPTTSSPVSSFRTIAASIGVVSATPQSGNTGMDHGPRGACAAGNVTVKTQPPLSRFAAVIWPPWARAIS
jgi:hypothetical protein